jgi:hypothetical protein
MAAHQLVNIHEHRIGNATEGFWRHIYDTYPLRRPAADAADVPGRAVFAAYRTNAPGTVAVFDHTFGYDLSRLAFRNVHAGPAMEPTDPSHELSLDADPFFCGRQDMPEQTGQNHRYGNSAIRTHAGVSRVFWAFPASSGGEVPGAVPIYEHRIELDLIGYNDAMAARCRVYVKYSADAQGGSAFTGCDDATSLTAEPRNWWRFQNVPAGGGYSNVLYAYARYSNKLAFYAFPAR